MVVRIRLARHGTRNNPFYHIVAINNRLGRNRKPLELLGVYDPIPRASERPYPMYPFGPDGKLFEGVKPPEPESMKKIEWSVDRIRYWLSVGAQPTMSVKSLFNKGAIHIHRNVTVPLPTKGRQKRASIRPDFDPKPPKTAQKPNTESHYDPRESPLV